MTDEVWIVQYRDKKLAGIWTPDVSLVYTNKEDAYGEARLNNNAPHLWALEYRAWPYRPVEESRADGEEERKP